MEANTSALATSHSYTTERSPDQYLCVRRIVSLRSLELADGLSDCYSVCIISIIRLIVLSRLGKFDVTWNYVNSAIWSAAEPCMGVISACLPSLRPGLSVLLRGSTKGLGVKKIGKGSAPDISRGSSKNWRSEMRNDDRERNFQRLDEPIESNKQRWGHEIAVRGGRPIGGRETGNEISLEETNVPAGGIRVKMEVVVTSSDWLDYKDKVF